MTIESIGKTQSKIIMKSVLIANRNVSETEAIRKVLGAIYKLHSVSSPAEPNPHAESCDLILLDANFTVDHGIDYLMGVLARRHVPILIITPVEEPQWAIEAVRSGAINYLVKTTTYMALLSHSINDAIDRFDDREELKRTIVSLRGRITELEVKVTVPALNSTGAAGSEKPKPPDKRASLIEEITRRLKQGEIAMPSYPEINSRLQELITKQADITEIAHLLREDPAVSSKLISVSNSARYAGGKESRTVEHAISRLGIQETRLYVEVVSNRALYTTSNTKYQPLLKELWEHSIACAHASQAISRLCLVGVPEEIFTMGLLHDIGSLLLLQIIADLEAKGVAMEEMTMDTHLDFIEAHHGTFGKSILDRWKFPELYGCIAMGHNVEELPDAPSPELLVVHFSNLLARTMGYKFGKSQEVDLPATKSAKMLRLRADEITQLAQEIKIQVEEALSHINTGVHVASAHEAGTRQCAQGRSGKIPLSPATASTGAV